MTKAPTTAPVQHPIPARFDDLVELYVKLRDKISAADDLHKEKMRPARDYLEALNAALLGNLNATGQDSAKTEHGTAYRSSRRTASIADAAVFRNYVITNQVWDVLDWKANATAVADLIAVGTPPPGVNFTTVVTAGVRRA